MPGERSDQGGLREADRLYTWTMWGGVPSTV